VRHSMLKIVENAAFYAWALGVIHVCDFGTGTNLQMNMHAFLTQPWPPSKRGGLAFGLGQASGSDDSCALLFMGLFGSA